MPAAVNRSALKNALQKSAKCYKFCALTFFNVVVLLVFLNVVSSLILKVTGDPATQQASNPITAKYGEDVVAQAYPELSSKDRDALLQETWSRPVVFEAFTQFKESAHAGEWVNVHTQGFRLSKNQGPWPPDPGNLNVFLFGGSTTFGYGVSDTQTIASYLQEYLQGRSGRPLKVYNFGRGWYRLSQERILFEKLLVEGHVPSVALFIDGMNDAALQDLPMYSEVLEAAYHRNTTKMGPCLKSIASELPLTKICKAAVQGNEKPAQVQGMLEDSGEVSYDEPLLAEVIEKYLRNKRLIEGACRAFGVQPVFVWQPAPVYKYNLKYHLFAPAPLDVNARDRDVCKRQVYSLMAKTIQEKPKEFSSHFLWLADIQEQSQEPLYADRVHYNAKFCKELAARVGDFVVEQNLLNTPSP